MSFTTDDLERHVARWPRYRYTGHRYAESVGNPASPEEELRNDGSRAMRTFFCEWDDRLEVMREFLGYPEIVKPYSQDPGAQYFGLSRIIPDCHPGFLKFGDKAGEQGEPFLWATQVTRCEPWGLPGATGAVDGVGGTVDMAEPPGGLTFKNSSIARYGLAKFQCLYESPTYEVLKDSQMPRDELTKWTAEYTLKRYVTKYIQPAASAFTVPTGLLKYVDNAVAASGTPVPGTPAIIEPKSDYIVIWHMVPTEAVGIRLVNPDGPCFPIDNCIGKVNATTFNGLPPGTLLLEACNPKPVRSAVGERLWDLEFRFKFFNPVRVQVTTSTGTSLDRATVTHNHIVRWKAGETSISYAEVSIDGATNTTSQTAGKNIHDWYEFKHLFRVPSPRLALVAGV
jgi:hypothetical protein